MSYLIGLLCIVVGLLGLNYYDWPPNRDITEYAVTAQELMNGKALYVDVWNIKPPAIFITYMIAQWLVRSKPLQILLLDLLPTAVVLVALIKLGREAGFGNAAGVWSGLFWVVLSGDIGLQMHEPNTEVFINACVMLAFLQLLKLQRESSILAPVMIGVLFAVACLFKTVAIAMAIVIGLTYQVLPPRDCRRSTATGQLAVMAASGATCIAVVFAYFVATERFQVFWEAMVGAGSSYAGDLSQNVRDGLTLSPIVGDRTLLRVGVAIVPWLAVALLAWFDRERRRSWLLLGAYAFSALVAVSLPGKFYAHYFQLLVPPLCLGLGWLTALFAEQSHNFLTTTTRAFLGLCLGVLFAYEARFYLMPAEMLLRGTYQELYLETQKLGRRLNDVLRDEEILYQWGDESGLYWYSGKRPPASVLTFPLFSGPQAARLTAQSVRSLTAQPPDLIVAVNHILDKSRGHPVFEWIWSHYVPLQPEEAGERKFFTFFVPAAASPELVRRLMSGVTRPRPPNEAGWLHAQAPRNKFAFLDGRQSDVKLSGGKHGFKRRHFSVRHFGTTSRS